MNLGRLALGPPAQRIFISYRRGDTQWLAGRLSDSLGAYFGDQRVFRDIDGIEGGADFSQVIRSTLDAAGALVVLIGKDWLAAADEQGRPRLHQSDDWVAQELRAALANGMRVYPVLVEDTPMPRAHELPESLRELTRFNALSVSDRRWDADVARLAKIVSLDIPSTTERHLNAVNRSVSAALWVAIALSMAIVAWNLFHAQPGWTVAQLFERNARGECVHPPPPGLSLIAFWQSGLIFLVLVPASALMFVAARHVDRSRRAWFDAAAYTAALGSALAYLLSFPVCEEYEATVVLCIGMVVAPLVLALMSVSGFKAK